MRITENIEMLEITGDIGTIYPTLVWDDNNLVLIDAGLPGQVELFKKAIEDAGFDAGNLSAIILTHQDIDHIGCVVDLLSLAPNAKVMAYKEEVPYIDGSKTPIKLAAMEANYENLPDDRKAWCDQFKIGFAHCKVKVDKELEDGEVLPICGGIQIIHTPGHTPGHICLYLQEGKVIIAGDAANIENGMLIGSRPQVTWNDNLAEESFEKIKNHEHNSVITYHGGLYKEYK